MKKTAITILLLTTISLSSSAIPHKNSVDFSYKENNKTLLDSIIAGSTRAVEKLDPLEIPISNIYTNNKTIKFTVGDLKGAKIDIRLLDTATDKTYDYKSISSFTDCIYPNLSTGIWLVYCTKIEYADGTVNENVNILTPFLLKELTVTESTSTTPPTSGNVINNEAIKVPILRYNPLETISNQKSEIKGITSSTVSIISYEYSNEEISNIQYRLVDGDAIVDSNILSPGDSIPYTFENLQPNKTYKIGYRVLNKSSITSDGTLIEGLWSDFALTNVTTNASKTLSVKQSLYSNNSLTLNIGARINDSMPMYKIKVLPADTPLVDVLATDQDVTIKNDLGVVITDELTKATSIKVDGLRIGEMYTVYITEVMGTNNTLIKSSPIAKEGTDSAVVAAVNIKVTSGDSDVESVVDYLLDNGFEELPPDLDTVSADKLKEIIDNVAIYNRTQASKLYYSKFGTDEIVTNHTGFNAYDYISLGGNIYATEEGPVKCVEYIEYRLPEVNRIYGIE